jgi:hypothetical protein
LFDHVNNVSLLGYREWKVIGKLCVADVRDMIVSISTRKLFSDAMAVSSIRKLNRGRNIHGD